MAQLKKWRELQLRAKRFLKQPAQNYYNVDLQQLPHSAGVYLLYLLDEQSEITPLSINFTSSIHEEITNKRLADSILNRGGRLSEKCCLLFTVEPDPKEQMALTVAISLLLKPTFQNN